MHDPINKQRMLRGICANVQTGQSLCCSHTQYMDVDEGSDQNLDL